MKTLEVKPVPTPSGASHPDPPHVLLPKHEFTMGLIAPKGSGKTTLLVNLLNFYKKHFHQIIIFSPTIKNDEKWKYVKDQKYLIKNKTLKEAMKKIHAEEKKNPVVGERPTGIFETPKEPHSIGVGDGPFTGKIPAECFITEYDQADLQSIMHQQQELVDYLEDHEITKHTADRILLIFDDLVGSTLFTSRKEDPFKKLNSNHRHYSISILMVSQAYKEIPKTVRTNFTCLILFKIFSESEKDAIHQEYPMGFPKDEWEKAYDYATKDAHDFLFFDIQKERGKQVMKCFSEVIYFNKNITVYGGVCDDVGDVCGPFYFDKHTLLCVSQNNG